MARSKSAFQIRLEYIPLTGIAGLLKRLPRAWGEGLCYGVLRLLLLFLPKRHRIMRKNLALCFPERTPKDREEIARQSLHTLARGIARLPSIPDLAAQSMDSWII